MENDLSSPISVPDFSEHFYQTKAGVPFKLVVLRYSNGTVATCPDIPENPATTCCEVLGGLTTFLGFSLSWKTHTVDCCLVSLHMDTLYSWFVACHDHIDVFWSTAIESFSLHQSTRALFWATIKLCDIQHEQILIFDLIFWEVYKIEATLEKNNN